MAIGIVVIVPLVAAVGLVATPLPVYRVAIVSVVVGSLIAAPLLALPVAVAGLVMMVRFRLGRRAVQRQAGAESLASLAEMTSIGLSGGLGIQSALQLAAEAVGGRVGEEAFVALRRMRIDGLGAASMVDGVGADLYRSIGRAAASGAALGDPVARIADELHADLAGKRLEAARRLPVAMLFPLTLLILPGFLLLTVAPALLEAFGRLEL